MDAAQTLRQKHRKEYLAWKNMKARCQNPSYHSFARYGGRGITVCERWQKFPAFLADVGLAPSPNHTLERRENDGNYEPGNVRWATRAEQQENTSATKRLTDGQKAQSIRKWARELSVSRHVVRRLLERT